MKTSPHPVVQIEKTIFKSFKNEGVLWFLRRYKIQFLSDQDPKEKLPPFQEILNFINHSTIKLPGKPWELRYQYKDIKGVTKILLHNDFNPKKPTLVFLHGLGMLNPLHLRLFTNHLLFEKFNIFSIKSSHHSSVSDIRTNLVNTFQNYATSLCASTLAIDEIVDFAKNNSSKKVVITGLSMGGMVASLHYFYFGSADLYFPVIAYPNLGEIALNKNLKPLIANYKDLKKNNYLKRSFVIPKNLLKRPKDKIFPMISKYDELIDFKKAKSFWSGYNTTILDAGHHSVFLKINDVRNFIISKTFE